MESNDRGGVDGDDPNEDESGDPSFIRENVRALREMTGLSQLEFGAMAGTNVKQIESGDRKGRWTTLAKIARAGGVPLWWLYVDRENRNVPVELQQLEESPIKPKVTPEEMEYLIALPVMLNRKFTYEAFYKALEMLRASAPKKPDDDSNRS